MKTINLRKGFTLIELLIVITIIGVLAVAFLPSILGAPAKARDVARKGHLNQISTALEAYVLDGASYPAVSNKAGFLCVDSTDLAPVVKYIQGGSIPKDPSNTDLPNLGKDCGEGKYLYVKMDPASAPTLNYALVAKVEDDNQGNASETVVKALNADKATFSAADKGAYYVLVK